MTNRNRADGHTWVATISSIVTIAVALFACFGIVQISDFWRNSEQEPTSPSPVQIVTPSPTTSPPTIQIVTPSPTTSPPTIQIVTPSPTTEPTFVIRNIPVDYAFGYVWEVPASGKYSFSIESGAYNPWETDKACAEADPNAPGCWRTLLFAYIGCEIDWQVSSGSDMAEPENADFELGVDNYFATLADAQDFATKVLPPVERELAAGDCVQFVVDDGYSFETGFSAFTDNRGESNPDSPSIQTMSIRILGP